MSMSNKHESFLEGDEEQNLDIKEDLHLSKGRKSEQESDQDSDQDSDRDSERDSEQLADSDIDEEDLEFHAEKNSDASIDSMTEDLDLGNSELAGFESAVVDEIEQLEIDQIDSIVESLLFASDKPVSLGSMRAIFKGTNVKTTELKSSLERIRFSLESPLRGVELVESGGGYQIRTKIQNQKFLLRNLKAKPFRLSGPALEVLSIVAYKQPVVKSEIDSIRGVESGHLLRALMEKSLVHFGERSDLPGKPMQYITSKKFLEVFGLRNLNELPSLSHIEDLMPEGIGGFEEKKSKLSDVTDELSQQSDTVFSVAEDELNEIVTEIQDIQTSTEFFEREKQEQKKRKMSEKAQSIREAILVGEPVSEKDKNWLIRYDEAQMDGRDLLNPEFSLEPESQDKV